MMSARMTTRADFDKIELYLIRVLQTLITERSVSRAAMRLHSTQPAVSAQLKRLRALTGDPLLVRAGNGMTPTETALRLLGPGDRRCCTRPTACSARACAAAQLRRRRPATATFRIAASDYLDPLFLPRARGPRQARWRRRCGSSCCRCPATSTTGAPGRRRGRPGDRQLARAAGGAAPRPADRRRDRLPGRRRPSGRAHRRRRAWTAERYLACEHVAPMPLPRPGAAA